MSWKLVHFHKWQAASVSPMEYVMKLYPSGPLRGMPMQEPIRQHVTSVLYRCECGRHKTEELNSLWTIEDLVGKK